LKIFDEVLVNALDRNANFPTLVKKISVSLDGETITVQNDGPLGGIAVEKHPTEGLWNPELTFGHLLTSTNYDDTVQRTVGGLNGLGCKLANIFSKRFEICICDGVNKLEYTQVWENNMGVCHPPKMKKYAKVSSSVSISFVPDWKKFGAKGLEDDFKAVIEKRVQDASFCVGGRCKVFFQDQEVPVPEIENTVSMKSDRWVVHVAPSRDGFRQVSYVNGVCTTKGGTHVDHVVGLITSGIIEDLGNKINLRPAQVKETLSVVIKATLVNPTFTSQVKSECSLPVKEFGSRCEFPGTFIKNII
jgi:DNA topoisomerase-2